MMFPLESLLIKQKISSEKKKSATFFLKMYNNIYPPDEKGFLYGFFYQFQLLSIALNYF